MSVRLRVLALGAAIAVTAVVAASPVAQAKSAASSTTVTIGMPYGTYFPPPIKTASAICAKQSGITIKSITDPADYNQYDLKLQLEAAAGKAPDLAVQGLDEVVSMGNDKYVTDLNSYIKGKSLYSTKTMPAIAAGSVNGHQVTIPWGVSTPVIFVNDSLFGAVGISSTTPFPNWAAVEAAAVKLTNKQTGQYGIAIEDEEAWLPLQFLLNSGSNFINAKGQPIFNNANGVFAAHLLQQLYTTGAAVAGSDEQDVDTFVQGKTAMLVSTIGNLPSLEKATFKWTTLPFPLVRTGIKTRIAAGGAGISVFAKPSRLTSALKALDCLFAPTVIRDVVQKLGYLPVRSDVSSLLKPGLLTSQPYKAAYSEFPLVVPWYAFPGPQGAQALQEFDDAWQKTIQTSGDPSSTLDPAASAIASLTGK